MSDRKQQIYVVFSRTNTNMGRLIRMVTRHSFNHVSISLDAGLHRMYSFARYHINSPLEGGLVHETPQRMLACHDVEIKVYRIDADPALVRRVHNRLYDALRRQEQLIYNTLGACGAAVGWRVRVPDAYTCVDFVATLLERPELASLAQLEQALEGTEIYHGGYAHYSALYGTCAPKQPDAFLERQSKRQVMVGTYRQFSRLYRRMIR